jgi:acyl-CoA thioesterase
MGNGFAHSSCLMWNDTGQLLATASQSMTIVPI